MPGALLGLAACWLGWWGQPAGGAPPGAPGPKRPVTDRDVQAAVKKAVAFLHSRQTPGGSFPNRHSKEFEGGAEALAALALLWAGQAPDEAHLRETLRYLNSVQPEQTYTRSLRVMVYSLLADTGRRRMREDVAWLLKHQQRNGGWGYGPDSAMTRLAGNYTDASNSQFALLALREASDAGDAVGVRTWRLAGLFWGSGQNTDGGWGYQGRAGKRSARRADSYGSMTAAAVASCFILAEQLEPPPRRRDDAPRAPGKLLHEERIARGMQWLKKNYDIRKVPGYRWTHEPSQFYYYLFCLARAGDAAGTGTTAGHDPAAEIARALCTGQEKNGSWGKDNSVVDTSLALLCLLKVAAPVVIARLDLDAKQRPAPAADPRDAARIARWLARKFRRPLTWLRVAPGEPVHPARCPLLYANLTGRSDPPKGLEKPLARFVGAGGTCLIQAPDKDAAEKIAQRCTRAIPGSRQADVAPDHPVFSLHFKIAPEHRRGIIGIGDERRTQVFLLAEDLSDAWHRGRFAERAAAFQLAGNLILYAGGDKLPRGRLAPLPVRPAPPKAAPPPVRRTIHLARVKYAGDFLACPQVVQRLDEALTQSLSVTLKELPPADASRPIKRVATVLWLTGSVPARFSRKQQAHLRKYLQAGGTLLIVPASGRRDFHDAARKLLGELLRPEQVRQSAPDSPLLTGRFAGGIGADLRRIRPGGATRPAGAPKLWEARIDDRIAAVLCAGATAGDIEGRPPRPGPPHRGVQARKLALNLILYAATHGEVPAGGAPSN